MKKALIIIGIVLGTLLLLSGSVVGLLQLKSVQTYIVCKVTEKLEEMLQVDVRVAQFHYNPLSSIFIDSVYLSDQQHDTLAYIEHLQAEFNPLALCDQRIEIQAIKLQNPYVNIQSGSDSTLNIQFLIDALKTDTLNFPYRLNISFDSSLSGSASTPLISSDRYPLPPPSCGLWRVS